MEMMSWHSLVPIQSGSHPESIGLHLPFLIAVGDESHAEYKLKPVISVLGIVEICVVVHWEAWHRSVEIGGVCSHVVLKFNGIFRGYTVGIGMVEINVVVDLWGMEVSWLTDGFASDNTSVGAWNTTVVVTEVIDIVLGSLPLEFGNSILCI